MSTNEILERLRKAGRNDDCPCGSGKKYKKCHLRADEESASKTLAEENATKAKEASAMAEDAGHEGHNHAPGEHPKAQASGGGPVNTHNGPRSHKPMNTPRKAV
ncbi:MAG: SEC-C metal-binding domain-containing protein [bacterium]